MAPAALHRQAEPVAVSERFLYLSSRFLLWGMFPLAAGICLDVYLVGRLIVKHGPVPLVIAALLFVLFVALWWGLPRNRKLHGIPPA
jgi:hypothetical protein